MMENGGEDATAVRTGGLVLVGVGLIAILTSFWWNSRGSETDPNSLVPTAAIVTGFETKIVKTKTSNERWIVIDVIPKVAGAEIPERWIFPAYSDSIESGLAQLEVGVLAVGLLAPDPVLVRWNDDAAVRLLWELSVAEAPVVPYALVRSAEAKGRYASPVIGLITIAMGIGLVLVSRLSKRAPAPVSGQDRSDS